MKKLFSLLIFVASASTIIAAGWDKQDEHLLCSGNYVKWHAVWVEGTATKDLDAGNSDSYSRNGFLYIDGGNPEYDEYKIYCNPDSIVIEIEYDNGKSSWWIADETPYMHFKLGETPYSDTMIDRLLIQK